ncbi:transglutaminase family protein [Gilvimarinus sp. SDUM040013]|uniref:Transglutaminase family protein n=1 Tax=Gilvimarinus gilvus TaxID=3058038 RepID=A0ABU4S4T5_9GAMM|nr:transglutaminase family protein [Gilvimarinus sp. SDUM040013]MDO3387165.1 transglutaminase family protein [Gilvimarinus sp. SDUM040013]MDX6850908.1 transglutaminase family protein [Gilvimarinus sp. SDUM040013]
MWLRASYELHFDITFPTPFILMLRPRSGAQQWIAREEYALSPQLHVDEFSDLFGNLCQRLVAPVGPFSIRTQVEVLTIDAVDRCPGAEFVEIQNLPYGVLNYLLPSRYCEAEQFNHMAQEITAGQTLGYDQVACIEAWLRRNISYEPGSGDLPVSAVGVNINQVGVCRDLSHLGIALCRALSIPARLVVGYLEGLVPMDMHAWFEAYVGDRWYTFDATPTTSPGGYIAIGYGRDAADVAVFNQFGPPAYPLSQMVHVEQFTPE